MSETMTASILKRYIIGKIDMLERHFYLVLTEQEKEHFNGLKSEIEVDNYARTILMTKL